MLSWGCCLSISTSQIQQDTTKTKKRVVIQHIDKQNKVYKKMNSNLDSLMVKLNNDTIRKK